jgi:hypothetical protein
MSDTLHATDIPGTIPNSKPSSETNPQGRDFVDRQILRRGRRKPRPDDGVKVDYRKLSTTALAKSKEAYTKQLAKMQPKF